MIAWLLLAFIIIYRKYHAIKTLHFNYTMPRQCIGGCGVNYSGNGLQLELDVSLHEWPKEKKIAKKWCKFVKDTFKEKMAKGRLHLNHLWVIFCSPNDFFKLCPVANGAEEKVAVSFNCSSNHQVWSTPNSRSVDALAIPTCTLNRPSSDTKGTT